MFSFLREHKDDAAAMLDACARIVRLEDLGIPLQRNQFLIINYLMQHREHLLATSFIGEKNTPEINRSRMQLLQSAQASDAAKQSFHARVVDLLASCAEGENQFIDSMCQNIFSTEDIVHTLKDKKINLALKRPYVKYFLWTYLKVCGCFSAAG